MSILDRLETKSHISAFDDRLNYLSTRNRDVSIISDGVRQVIENISSGTRSLVVYGEPQSGKTEFMIALVCKLLDEGKKTIFVIMNDNTDLEDQNFDRFLQATQINPSPMTAPQFVNLLDGDKKTDLPRVIFCRKNGRNLEKLITEARFLKDRVVLDDEADYASPDTNINKDEYDPSKINELVEKLGDLSETGTGVYIGVTATPGRLDLNGTFANDARKWVFLGSHAAYKGRAFFFPISEEQKRESNYILTTLPEQGDDPRFLKEAFLRFLVRTAVVNLRDNKANSPEAYSMLIHTEGTVAAHEEDQKQIQSFLSVLQNRTGNKIEKYLEYMDSVAIEEIVRHELNFTSDNVLNFILKFIGKSSVLIVNHKKENKNNVRAACQPKNVFTVAIGGNIVSRGLTFDNLISFFFSRSVKSKFQQNTYIQRARMFGTRPYSEFMELCVPEELFGNWADCFFDHELSLSSARAGDYVHISSGRTSPADSASIDKSSTLNYKSEWRTGTVFKMPQGIEKMFSGARNERPLDFIGSLKKRGIIPEAAFNDGLHAIIQDVADFDQSDVVVYLDANDEFLYPSKYTDFVEETITRGRGGLVAATVSNRPDYDNKAIILPVKNKFGEMCFYYKNNLGKKVVKNIRNK